MITSNAKVFIHVATLRDTLQNFFQLVKNFFNCQAKAQNSGFLKGLTLKKTL